MGPAATPAPLASRRPPGSVVLDEMSGPLADNGLQSTPLSNTKWPSTCGFMSSMVALIHEVWIYDSTSEIMKTIIARDLTGLRT